MDTLFISPKTEQELSKYCESNLLITVFDYFKNKGKVISKNDNETPSRWWIITDFLNNKGINNRNKYAVILSMGAIGGVIQIGEQQLTGDVKILCFLKEHNYIEAEDFEYFIDAFYLFSKGQGLKFNLI